MSKFLLAAAVLTLAACGERRADTPAADTAAVVAPAPTPPPDTTVRPDTTVTDTTRR